MRAQGARNLAIVVVDNANGEVLAEVGGARYSNADPGAAIDLVRQRRQPGSTLKPFVYARAFEGTVSPMSPLPDVPTQHGATGAHYAPENFDGTFSGPIPAREALSGSLNVPAVRLAAELGSKDLHALLGALGFQLPHDAAHYGLSLALGSAEVSPLELAQAYVALARGGEFVPVTDRRGQAGAQGNPPRRVLAAAAVAEVTDALSDPLARVRGLRSRGSLELPFPAALKTGTSSGYRDAWTAGYTRERTVVVWVGNADGTPTQKLTGGQGAGPLFVEVMTRAMRDVPLRAPLIDSGVLVEVDVCPLSGQRISSACGGGVTRKVAPAHVPRHECTMHVHAKVLGANNFACEAAGPARVVVLPDEYSRFLRERPPGAPGLDPMGLPWLLRSQTAGCQLPAQGAPRIVVLEPLRGAVYRAHGARGEIPVAVDAPGAPRAMRLELVLDGQVVGELDGSLRGSIPALPGEHDLEVRPVESHRASWAAGRVSFQVN
jgi:penicillin-binding protein 1C